MSYPKYLLPKRYFRTFSIDELCPSQSNFHLVRRSAKGADETFDSFGFARIDALLGEIYQSGFLSANVKETQGLSHNILGGKYTVEHIRFRSKDNAALGWRDGERVDFKDFRNNIEELQESIPIYILLREVHKRTIPYVRNIDSSYKKKIPPQFALPNGPHSVQAEVEFIHKPTVSNFWHVELRFKDMLSGDLIKRDNISNSDLAKDKESWKSGTQVAMSIVETILIPATRQSISASSSIPFGVYNRYYYETLKWVTERRKALRSSLMRTFYFMK